MSNSLSHKMIFSVQAPEVDVLSWRRVYFVGIKGVGMTSLAVLLHQAGIEVSGADTEETFVTEKTLRENAIAIHVFSSAVLPEELDAVVFSGAHGGRKNPLVQTALQNGVPCFTLAEATGALSRSKKTFLTCGVGGKSTTSAWLSTVLELAGMRPSFSVGVGSIPNLGTSGKWQDGEWFIVEGDEYVADPSASEVSPRFLTLQPTAALCTGVAYDHPDVYASWSETVQAFQTLWSRLPANGFLVVSADDPGTGEVLETASVDASIIRVSQGGQSDVHWESTPVGIGSKISITWQESGETLSAQTLLPGEHNALNAVLVAVSARALGVDLESIQEGLSVFRSTPRRFEYRGENSLGAAFFDDYAHHPRELAAVAQTAKEWFVGKEVVVAFQPHTFSRTKALFSEFLESLSKFSGRVLLLPIFASARESADTSVSSEQLVAALQERGVAAELVHSTHDLAEIFSHLPQGVIGITAGAGDIYEVYEFFDQKITE